MVFKRPHTSSEARISLVKITKIRNLKRRRKKRREERREGERSGGEKEDRPEGLRKIYVQSINKQLRITILKFYGDRPSIRQTDIVSYRGASTRLKDNFD